jgi:multicomponent Na+:H+ antiporter subunit D
MLFAEDLFDKYLFLEFLSLPVYILVAFRLEEARSTAAGYHYMIIGSVATMCILTGFALVYSQTGSLALHQSMTANSFQGKSASALILVGFLIKCGTFPSHAWLIPAHANTPSGNSAILSGILIQSILFAGLDAMFSLQLLQPKIGALLIFLALANMTIGNLLAIRKKRMKTMLASSSIVQMGYILFAFGAYLVTGSQYLAFIALYFILAHAFSKALSFLSTGVLYRHFRITHNKHLNGVGRKDPYPAFMLALSLLSLASVPPFPLFFAKWSLLTGILQSASPWLLSATVILLANSLLSLKYYLPQVFNLFRIDPANPEAQHPVEENPTFSAHNWMMVSSLTILFLAMLAVTLGWFWQDHLPIFQNLITQGVF